MRAGTLTHLAEFQRKLPTKNAYGEQRDEWEQVGTFRVSILPVHNAQRELVQADSVINEVTHILRMRHNVGKLFAAPDPYGGNGFGQPISLQPSVDISLSPDMRVISNDKLYRIVSVVAVDNASREIEMRLAEGWEE